MLKNETDYAKILKETTTIAVVGLSPQPWRASYGIAAYLMRAGYKVIGVNPNYAEVLGQPCYPSLQDIGEPVDLVDIFRDPDYVLPIVEDAIAIGAKTVWMQPGATNPAAVRRAEEAGLNVVADRCIKVEHARAGVRS